MLFAATAFGGWLIVTLNPPLIGLFAPPEMIEALDKHLKTTSLDYRIEWYPQTHHGFVFPLRQGMYHKPSAERHWERLLQLFGRRL